MSMQTSVTVYLAYRQRLFRELLQHAFTTASSGFRVVEAADTMPSSSVLNKTDWLIVDEETAPGVEKLAGDYPKLGILALEGRGSRLRVISPAVLAEETSSMDVPTLAQLFELLSHVTSRSTEQRMSQQKESQH